MAERRRAKVADLRPRARALWNTWAIIGLVVAAVVVVWGIERGTQPTLLVGAAFFVWTMTWTFGFRFAVRRIHRRALARLMQAWRDADTDAARAALEELRGVTTKSADPLLALYEATILSMDERWGDSLVMLEKIPSAKLDVRVQTAIVNGRAWCLAHLGRAKEAIDLAAPNLEAARTANVKDVSAYVGTLGVSQLLAGDPETAVVTIEEAMRLGGDARLTTIRALYLGDAYRAVGRTDDARGMYRKAIDVQPKGRWAERARQRLEAIGDAPYRG